MFSLLPGSGLGISASQELAFGLWAMIAFAPPVEPPIPTVTGAYATGGGSGFHSPYKERPGNLVPKVVVFDNAYSAKEDEIVEILYILFGVIE